MKNNLTLYLLSLLVATLSLLVSCTKEKQNQSSSSSFSESFDESKKLEQSKPEFPVFTCI